MAIFLRGDASVAISLSKNPSVSHFLLCPAQIVVHGSWPSSSCLEVVGHVPLPPPPSHLRAVYRGSRWCLAPQGSPKPPVPHTSESPLAVRNEGWGVTSDDEGREREKWNVEAVYWNLLPHWHVARQSVDLWTFLELDYHSLIDRGPIWWPLFLAHEPKWDLKNSSWTYSVTHSKLIKLILR